METIKKQSSFTELKKYKGYYLMLLPIVIWYVIFSYIPMGGIAVAFLDYNIFKGIGGSQWVGLKWFIELFTLPDIRRVTINTLIISLYSLIIAFPAPIIFALLLNEIKSVPFKRTVQTISYLPHFISWPVIAGLVTIMLSPSSGFVNKIIVLLGGKAIYFMAEPQFTRGIIVFASLWKELGWSTIIYLAAIAGINIELYESAYLDGANKLQQARYITIPGMSNIIVMLFIFTVSGIFSVGFEQAYNLVIPPTYETGQVISMYVYQEGVRNFHYGYSTAIGFVQSILGILLLVGANALAKRFSEEGAIW